MGFNECWLQLGHLLHARDSDAVVPLHHFSSLWYDVRQSVGKVSIFCGIVSKGVGSDAVLILYRDRRRLEAITVLTLSTKG